MNNLLRTNGISGMEDLTSSIGINKRKREEGCKRGQLRFCSIILLFIYSMPIPLCMRCYLCIASFFSYHLYFLQFNLEAFWSLFVHRSVGVQPQEDEDRKDLPQMRDPRKHSVDVEGYDDVNLHEEGQQGRQAKKKDRRK